MRYFLALLGLLAMPAYAESWSAIPSTPDLSVSASATTDVQLPATANFVAIKNDCSSDVYFRLTAAGRTTAETAAGLGDGYPIRLKAGESFSAPIVATTVGASNSSSTAACTFTLFLAR